MDIWGGLHILNRALEAAPLLPLACAWIRRHHLPPAFRAVYYYVGVKSLLYFLDMFSRLVFRNNVYVYHVATAVLVGCLLRTYSQLLPPRWHPLLRGGLALFAAMALLDALFLNGLFTDVNTYSQALGCALLLVAAILHMLHLTRSTAPGPPLEQQPEFFLSAAVLVYCSSSIVSYVAINSVYHTGYDAATLVRLDVLLSAPDMLLMALHMGLLAWMFQFFPLSISPRRALPRWLHYSTWQPRHYRLLGHVGPVLRRPRAARWLAPAAPSG